MSGGQSQYRERQRRETVDGDFGAGPIEAARDAMPKT